MSSIDCIEKLYKDKFNEDIDLSFMNELNFLSNNEFIKNNMYKYKNCKSIDEIKCNDFTFSNINLPKFKTGILVNESNIEFPCLINDAEFVAYDEDSYVCVDSFDGVNVAFSVEYINHKLYFVVRVKDNCIITLPSHTFIDKWYNPKYKVCREYTKILLNHFVDTKHATLFINFLHYTKSTVIMKLTSNNKFIFYNLISQSNFPDYKKSILPITKLYKLFELFDFEHPKIKENGNLKIFTDYDGYILKIDNIQVSFLKSIYNNIITTIPGIYSV